MCRFFRLAQGTACRHRPRRGYNAPCEAVFARDACAGQVYGQHVQAGAVFRMPPLDSRFQLRNYGEPAGCLREVPHSKESRTDWKTVGSAGEVRTHWACRIRRMTVESVMESKGQQEQRGSWVCTASEPELCGTAAISLQFRRLAKQYLPEDGDRSEKGVCGNSSSACREAGTPCR